MANLERPRGLLPPELTAEEAEMAPDGAALHHEGPGPLECRRDHGRERRRRATSHPGVDAGAAAVCRRPGRPQQTPRGRANACQAEVLDRRGGQLPEFCRGRS
jgi:hypothetical protein